MVGEWRTQTFAELVGGSENVIGGPFGSNLTQADYLSSGVPVIRGSNMEQNGRFVAGEFAYVSFEKAQKLHSNQVKAGDIVVTQRGTLGQVSIVPPNPVRSYIVSQSQMGVRVSKSDPMFVFYLLRSPEFEKFLAASTIQAGVPHINLTMLREWQIVAPEPRVQRQIALVLSALDDKIELNRRMAETLEAMARALFKSWFVDFEPVRARAEGRPIDIPRSVLELFPSQFDDCGRPAGWIYGPLREHFEILSGGTPSKAERKFWDGDIPWVTPLSMTKSHVSNSPNKVTNDAIGRGTRMTPEGSVLVMVRGMGLHEGVRISQARRAVAFNQDVKALVPRTLDPDFALFLLLENRETLLTKVRESGHGTGVLPTDALEAIAVNAPPRQLQPALFQPLKALNARLALARSESMTLAALRDTLLPKLISGELRVADAKKQTAVA